MVNFDPTVRQTTPVERAPQQRASQPSQQTNPPREQTSLNPTDHSQTRSYASGSSPASVNFTENIERKQQEEQLKRPYNPLVAIFAVMMSLAGGNPDLLGPAQQELDGAMEVFNKHGQNTEVNIFGSVREPEDLNPFDNYTEDDRFPNREYGKG